MKIIFAVIGLNRLFEEEVMSGEPLKDVIARIARKLYTSELADMILVYKTVDPFNKNDKAVKKLQKGSISAAIRSNLQSVTRNDTVKIQSCATDKVHFVLDVATRDASPVRFNYASERRYISLAKTAKKWAVLSYVFALLFCILATLSPVFGILAFVCLLLTISAYVASWVFEQKAQVEFILIQDDGDDGCVIIDYYGDYTSLRALNLE